jgi:hypothetical protein
MHKIPQATGGTEQRYIVQQLCATHIKVGLTKDGNQAKPLMYYKKSGGGVKYIYIYIYLQGVTGGTDNTSGECSLGQTIPI